MGLFKYEPTLNFGQVLRIYGAYCDMVAILMAGAIDSGMSTEDALVKSLAASRDWYLMNDRKAWRLIDYTEVWMDNHVPGSRIVAQRQLVEHFDNGGRADNFSLYSNDLVGRSREYARLTPRRK